MRLARKRAELAERSASAISREGDLHALLQKLLQLLRRQRLGAVWAWRLLLLAQAHEELDQLRLELAAELHRLGALVGQLLAASMKRGQVLAQSVQVRGHLHLFFLGLPVLEQVAEDVGDALGQS